MNITLSPEAEKRLSENFRRGAFVKADAIIRILPYPPWARHEPRARERSG